ncbi:hypothetical protein L1987_59318 [Smallanthus sonchifolius]|uniref:Uncharacterized protein n=1 Tax=Smallanthus sonchifolius TaxID=185202 RepID=A0ACB9D4Y4_9ASTR|nr:hypothetical protein L1987_59318 [Smallanthus sonchifolius]
MTEPAQMGQDSWILSCSKQGFSDGENDTEMEDWGMTNEIERKRVKNGEIESPKKQKLIGELQGGCSISLLFSSDPLKTLNLTVC